VSVFLYISRGESAAASVAFDNNNRRKSILLEQTLFLSTGCRDRSVLVETQCRRQVCGARR